MIHRSLLVEHPLRENFEIRVSPLIFMASNSPPNICVILRNASFHGDAGKIARNIFGHWKGSARGRRNAARAEIPLENILKNPEDESGP